jgi:C1A family cysteine protease
MKRNASKEKVAGLHSQSDPRKRAKKEVAQLDLLAVAEKTGFLFTVHDQGEDETCVAHATTAMHEIITRKRLSVKDLVLEWMQDIGALMVDVSRLLATTGQQEEREQVVSKRPTRRCQTALKLDCHQLQSSLSICKNSLRLGFPFVLLTEEFSRRMHKMTVKNRPRDKSSMRDQLHALCVYGYKDDPAEEGGGNFLVINSHGTGWGDEGKGTISYSFFEEYTHQVWGPI